MTRIARLDVARAAAARGWRRLTPLERDLLDYAAQVLRHGEAWAIGRAVAAYRLHRANGLSEREAWWVVARANLGFIDWPTLTDALDAAVAADLPPNSNVRARLLFRRARTFR